jgi:D-alanyl-D-alanine carboxypeptidase
LLSVLLPTAASAQPKVDGRAASIVIDMNTGEVLYARSADQLRYPASLTKMMTLYVLFNYMKHGKIGYETELVVTPYAAARVPTKLGLKAGETIKTIDAIKGLITRSANDAAAVIAENIGGTEDNFGRIMTEQARALGMRNTVFRNASGLPDPYQVSTARDLAILSQRLIRDFPEHYHLFSTKSFIYRGVAYRNHNRLLFDYRGADGLKTGFIRASGFNLATSARRDNKHLVAVVMGGDTAANRNATMRSLLDRHWGKARPGSGPGPLIASAGAPADPTRKPGFALAGAVASIAQPAALRAQPERLAPSGGGYYVQVGAFPTQQEAQARIAQVQGQASDVLSGYNPVTTVFQKGSATFHRARFAGFTESSGRSACERLKRQSIDCIVMRAD